MTQTDAMTLIHQLLQEQGFIPALTIHQPYASLLGCKAKRYETRGWATKHRGWTLIHAGLKIPHYDNFPDTEISIAAAKALGFDEAIRTCDALCSLPRGEIIAIAELVNCWRIVYNPGTDIDVAKHIDIGAELDVPRKHPDFHKYIVPTAQEQLFGRWTPGNYAWEFANMTMLPEPIKVPGKQKIWRWRGEGLA